MSPHRAVVVALVAGLLGACHLLRPVLELEVELEALPPAWAAAFGSPPYEVRWRGPDGVENTVVGAAWSAGPTGQTLTLPDGVYTPLVVTPYTAGPGGPPTDALLPAGAVCPLDATADAKSILISFEQGPVACVLEKLLCGEAGVPPGDVDVERMAREIVSVGQGNPWSVDQDALVDSILAGEMVCRRIPASGVTAPYPCSLVWDNPLAPPLGATETLACWGLHRLYVCDASGRWVGERLDLWLDAHEVLWLPIPP